MRQKHVLTALAIIAVTGAVSVPNSLAVTWRLDVSEQNVVGRGGVEWNPLIHKVADAYSGMSGGIIRPEAASSQQGAMPGAQSRQPGESTYGSPSNDTRYGGKPSDPSYHKESSGSPTSPYSETIYGGVPTTPSADPAVRELNRDPSMR